MSSPLKSMVAAGGAAVITVTFIHPIDVLKTRLQTSGEAGRGGKNYGEMGMLGSVKSIAADEGVASFWKGIGPAWLREASYTSLRLGLYAPLKHAFGADKPDTGFFMKFFVGSLAGGIGSLAGNPFDVLKTQMMASEKSGSEALSLGSSASALMKEQGIGGFYRGLEANVMRAMVLNGTKMACYDTIKGMIVENFGWDKKGMHTQAAAATGAGVFMATTVAPFDKVRTRLMNQPADARLYNGFTDCSAAILKNEGFMGFYRGWLPIWMRFAPTTCCQLIIMERVAQLMGISAT